MPVPYLSDEWLARADDLLSGTSVEPAAGPVTIATVVTGPGGTVAEHVVEVAGGCVRMRRPAPGETATVRLTQSYRTAAAVAQGQLSAQAAFLAADIQVGGDVRVLITHLDVVAAIGDALAPLRDDTTYDEALVGA